MPPSGNVFLVHRKSFLPLKVVINERMLRQDLSHMLRDLARERKLQAKVCV
jgi:hypothetical protein